MDYKKKLILCVSLAALNVFSALPAARADNAAQARQLLESMAARQPALKSYYAQFAPADTTPATDKAPLQPAAAEPLDAATKITVRPSTPENATSPILLRDALLQAYSRSPLRQTRQGLKSGDTIYTETATRFTPSMYGDSYSALGGFSSDPSEIGADPKTVSLEVSQPIYRSGAARASLAAFENRLRAQRALLQVKEQDFMISVTKAFMDVLRDQEILRKREELEDTPARIAQARRALDSSRAAFLELTGMPASDMARPQISAPLPASLEEALDQADYKNPAILYAHYRSAAAEAATRQVSGTMEPQIDLKGSLDRMYDSFGNEESNDSGVIGLRATIPLFSGTDPTLRAAEAKLIETERRHEVNSATRAARQQVIAAWEELTEAQSHRDRRGREVQMARDALALMPPHDPARQLAEEVYMKIYNDYVSADCDSVVAAQKVLAATGQLKLDPLLPEEERVQTAFALQNAATLPVYGDIQTAAADPEP